MGEKRGTTGLGRREGGEWGITGLGGREGEEWGEEGITGLRRREGGEWGRRGNHRVKEKRGRGVGEKRVKVGMGKWGVGIGKGVGRRQGEQTTAGRKWDGEAVRIEEGLTRMPISTPYLVMELVPTVQVKCIKLLHVFCTDHTLILTIHQWFGGSLLRGRSYGNWSPDGSLQW